MEPGPFQPPATDAPSATAARQRGGCLTALLGLMLVINPLVGIMYLLAGSTIAASMPNAPGWVVPVLGVLALANTAGAAGLWMWKRWGFYVVVGVAALAFVINLIAIPGPGVVTGLLGPVILGALVWPRWNDFD